MATRRKLLLNFIAIIFAAMAGALVHYEVNKISSTFIAIRVAEVNVFAKLVRDNWNGIKSVSDENKKLLLQTLDPARAGAEIRVIRAIIIIMFYGLVGCIILDRTVAMFKLWRGSRSTNPARQAGAR
jgi:hypothetical protein